MIEEIEKIQEKTQPKKNCINFWEKMLFYDKAFLPHSTVVIIKATVKHLKSES